MLHPSYSDLMKVVNSEVEPGEAPIVNSRYSIVMATSKRARQIVAGDDAMVDTQKIKPLSMAVDELGQGKIKILTEEEAKRAAEEMAATLLAQKEATAAALAAVEEAERAEAEAEAREAMEAEGEELWAEEAEGGEEEAEGEVAEAGEEVEEAEVEEA